MRILEYLRNKVFWCLDAIHGKEVKKHYSLLKKIESNSFDDSELEEYQRERIAELLQHARNTVPFYKDFSSDSLDDYPVVNKNIIRENYSGFLSDIYSKDDMITMSTSGSTGTPFVSYQNKGKKKSVNAETIYYNGKIGYEMGKRIIYFRSIVSEVKKSPIQQFMQNIFLLDCYDLSNDGIQSHLRRIEKLTKHSPAMLMGYASTMDAFARYFERYGYDSASKCHIYGIASGSEMLKDQTREILARAFCCKCVSRYANEENGFLGQDASENNVFLNNRADYFIEILKMDSDVHAEDGEIGRIVVTDYYNMAMPMIRYDTGDVGAWQTYRHDNCTRKAIGKFAGRKIDQIFDCDGRLISAHSITNMMWNYPVICQYQFVQKQNKLYLMKINIKDNDIDEERLISDLHRIVGDHAIIELQYVDEIPVLASGKRKYIVNEMSIQ